MDAGVGIGAASSLTSHGGHALDTASSAASVEHSPVARDGVDGKADGDDGKGPATASAKDQPAKESKGWISWAWGAVAAAVEDTSGGDGDDGSVGGAGASPVDTVPVLAKAKKDTVTVVNALLTGLSLTLYRRDVAKADHGRRRYSTASMGDGDVALAAAAAAASASGSAGGGAAAPRVPAYSRSTISELTGGGDGDDGNRDGDSDDDGDDDGDRAVTIQVPVANVGFVAVAAGGHKSSHRCRWLPC